MDKYQKEIDKILKDIFQCKITRNKGSMYLEQIREEAKQNDSIITKFKEDIEKDPE